MKSEEKRKKSNMNCPFCQVPLTLSVGDQLHPGAPEYGITVDCGNKVCSCTASGHGKNEKDALEVFSEKCRFGLKKS